MINKGQRQNNGCLCSGKDQIGEFLRDLFHQRPHFSPMHEFFQEVEKDQIERDCTDIADKAIPLFPSLIRHQQNCRVISGDGIKYAEEQDAQHITKRHGNAVD